MRFAVLGLACLYWLMAVTATRHQSATFDEPVYLGGGYSYWLREDFRLNLSSGNLPQRLATIPFLFTRPAFPSTSDDGWLTQQEHIVGRKFLYESGNDPARILLIARMMIALLGAGLAVLVFIWSSELFGPVGGFISMILAVFSPTALANGGVVSSDMAVTFFFCFATWALWKLLHRVSPATLATAGLSLSGLMLSKMSAVLILPLAAALVVVRMCSRQPLIVDLGRTRLVSVRKNQLLVLAGAALVILLMVITSIWMFFSFRYETFNPAQPPPVAEDNSWLELLDHPGMLPAVISFARVHHLLPKGFLNGFTGVLNGAQQRRAFLNGEYGGEGFRWFFPYAFLVKTPLPLFILLTLGLVASWQKWASARIGIPRFRDSCFASGIYSAAPLMLLIAIYGMVAIKSHLNIGNRHIFPLEPPLWILAGESAGYFTRKRVAESLLTSLSLIWFAGESIWIRPHYLAYFNEIDGGPAHAYRHLVDSSLDWGQDLPGLRLWLDEHNMNQPDRAFISYFGTAPLDSAGIRATSIPYQSNDDLAGIQPYRGGVYCISATRLQTVYTTVMGRWCVPYEKMYRNLLPEMQVINRSPVNRAVSSRARETEGFRISVFEELRFARLCAWLRQREPDAEIGYSILIYRLTDDDVTQALYGRPAELLHEIELHRRE